MLIVLMILLAAVKIGSAQPTQVVTQAATNITENSAQLNGVINPGVSPTEWTFAVYDTSSGGLLFTIDHGVVGADTIASVATQLTSLQPSTKYGFSLKARWVGMSDWADGGEAFFSTLPSSQSFATMNTMMTIYTNVMTAFFSSTTSSQPLGPGFDFTMSISPASASVTPGGTAHYAVGVMYSDPSYAGTMINIQLTGLGPGMDYALSPNGALTITTSPTTPTGSYPFTIIGSASGVMHQTGGTLIVTPPNNISTTPVTITTPPTTTTPTPVVTVTSVVSQTATVQPSPTSTESSTSNTQTTTSDVIGILQQNSLLIIGILVIALAAVLLSGRRRSAGQVTQTQQQTTNVTYCSHCGTQNPTTNSYCRKCGTKLQT